MVLLKAVGGEFEAMSVVQWRLSQKGVYLGKAKIDMQIM
jgi:hypothetical protein